MITTLIIDDEPNAIKALKILIEKYVPELVVSDVASNIEDGHRLILHHKPDLIFLDINMPNGTGLDLIRRIQPMQTKVIFVTAYQEYAIKALRLSAHDYLLKPVDKNELIEAIKRLQDQSNNDKLSEMHSIMLDILEDKENRRIAINSVNGVSFLDLDQILYLAAEKNYTVIIHSNGEVVSSKSLGDYEKTLAEEGFVRTHRSYLVNLQKISEFQKKEMKLIMVNGERLEVSRSKKDLILESLKVI